MSQSDTSLKAYTVHDGDECSVIVFAKAAVIARRLGSNEMDCEFESVKSCLRTTWADEYAPGPVPKLAMIDAGWWFECSGCSRRIDDESYDYEADEPIEMEPVEYGQCIYCCEECRQRKLAERTRVKKLEGEAREALAAIALTRYPNAHINSEHAYVVERDGWYNLHQCHVQFRFPGCRYFGAELRIDSGKSDIVLYVASGDQAAWRNWIAAGCPAQMAVADNQAA